MPDRIMGVIKGVRIPGSCRDQILPRASSDPVVRPWVCGRDPEIPDLVLRRRGYIEDRGIEGRTSLLQDHWQERIPVADAGESQFAPVDVENPSLGGVHDDPPEEA